MRIGNAYIGNGQVSKIYRGSTLVWHKPVLGGFYAWGDFSNTLQTNLINGTIPAKVGGGTVTLDDVDTSILNSIYALNMPAATIGGTIEWDDLDPVFQQFIYDEMVPDGYATGTTGGFGGTTTTVSSDAAFTSAVAGDSAKHVIVSGNVTVGYTSIGDNTTITCTVGSSLTGTIRMDGVTNVILKNIKINAPKISGANQDAIAIANSSSMVWVTHCEIYDWTDGSCDITKSSDFVTVSWCKFYQTTIYDHALAMLIGANPADADNGKLHVTVHHNYFGDMIEDRCPRVRWGSVHVYNNVYDSDSTGTGVNTSYITMGYNAHIRSENNYFKTGEDAYLYKETPDQGICFASGDHFVAGFGGSLTEPTDSGVFTPPYSYTPQLATDAYTDVIARAGIETGA